MAPLETLLQRRAAGRRRTIAIATLNVALVWCIAGAVLWQSYRDAVSDGKRMAENLSLTTAAFTHQALTASDLMLQSVLDWISEENVASEEEFERILNGRRFHDSMRHRMVALPQAVVAAVFGKDGHLLSSSLSWPPPPTNVAGREAFLAQLDPAAPALSVSPTLEINTRQWVFFLTRKVRSISTQLLGVAVVGVDANFFAKLFRSISIGEDSSISLFRLDGSLLATTLDNPDLLGKRYENALPLRMIREGLSGTAQLVHEPMWWNPADTEGRIVAPRQVEGLPAFIAVTIGDRSFLAQWRPRVYLVIAVALAITAITALVTLQFLRLGARSDSAARLAAERRLLAALIDTPAALCAMVDRQGRVIYCNERFRSILASGREADDILRAPELRGADPILAFAGGGGDQPIEVDLEVIEADKVTRFLHFSVSSQALPDIGRCTILVGHDETLRHQAQSAIAQTAKLVTLGEMTSGMAHELSQPLNVIRMAAQNALSEIEPAETEDRGEELPPQLSDAEFRPFVAAKLARIVAQVDRAASIISRMRVFGRTPDGPPRPYDARDACRGSMALVGQRLRNGGITVREVLDEKPLMVHGQQNLLEQVLVNLLLNARDALRDSERNDKVIELLAKRGGASRILLTVTDNGPGIPLAIRERIFEPFFTSKPTGRGTGLGLSLSFGIVREAGGTLSLLPGTSGTAFQIDLPADSQAETT